MIVVAALGYVVSATVAARMDRDLLGPDLAGRAGADHGKRYAAWRAGWSTGRTTCGRSRPAGQALAAIAAHRFFYGISTISAILLFRSYFNDPDDVDAGLAGLATAFAASGLGFFLAARDHPRDHPPGAQATLDHDLLRVRGRGAEPSTSSRCSEWLLLVGAFVLGVAAQGSKICVDTIVQESIDDAYRGRVFSFYDVLFNVVVRRRPRPSPRWPCPPTATPGGLRRRRRRLCADRPGLRPRIARPAPATATREPLLDASPHQDSTVQAACCRSPQQRGSGA